MTILWRFSKGVGQFIIRWQNWICAIVLIVAIFLGCRFYPHPSLKDQLPLSQIIYDQNGQLLRLTLAKDDRYRLWVPLDQISPNLIKAVQIHEDQWFYWHFGVNPYGILRGAWVTYISHGNRQGGSTITMQLARLLYQLNTKKPVGKLTQIYYAIKLELFYSKNDILEAYLNLAPYGGNIEGIETASLIYFNKKSYDLNLPQSLLLAIIPQEPNLRIRCLDTKNTNCFITNKHLLNAKKKLYQAWIKYYPKDINFSSFMALPIPLTPISKLPFQAPHFVEQILSLYPKKTNIVTTLDLQKQHILETQIKNYIKSHRNEGINNIAAILVDTNDMGIKALVGSGDFYDTSIHGQINGTLIRRSPGSSLKPFVYALGIEQGIIHPQSILYDIPMNFSGYTPENFDNNFEGPLTATKALNTSRNIPAVWIASQLKKPDFSEFFAKAGMNHLAKKMKFGLSLVLGGGEITMQEEAMLYASLGYNGNIRPLKLLNNQPSTDGRPLLSNESRFIVLDMLSKHIRPDENTSSAILSPFPIAWKTGTSSGFRDAWTAGLFSHYILIVWAGNFDNTANNNLVGLKATSPLFFNIIDAFHQSFTNSDLQTKAWQTPKNIKKIIICLTSGDLPNRWCPQLGYTWFIPGISPIKVSTLHKLIIIDNNTHQIACPPFKGKKTHTEIYEFWPTEVIKTLKKTGLTYRTPPKNQTCQQSFFIANLPHIISPHTKQTYILKANLLTTHPIVLAANTTSDTQYLYWFANNIYLGKTSSTANLYWIPQTSGNYSLRVIDDRGQSNQVNVHVIITN